MEYYGFIDCEAFTEYRFTFKPAIRKFANKLVEIINRFLFLENNNDNLDSSEFPNKKAYARFTFLYSTKAMQKNGMRCECYFSLYDLKSQIDDFKNGVYNMRYINGQLISYTQAIYQPADILEAFNSALMFVERYNNQDFADVETNKLFDVEWT